MSASRAKIPAIFILSRLHSLAQAFLYASALVFVFAFSSVLSSDGITHFGRLQRFVTDIPQLKILNIFLVWLPFAFALSYGLVRSLGSRPGVPTPLTPGLFSYWAERVFFAVALTFLVLHTFVFHPAGDYISWVRLVSDSRTFLVYLAGTGALLYWLARGAWHFLVDWGVIVNEEVQAWAWKTLLSVAILGFAVSTLVLVKLKYHYEAPLPWIRAVLDQAARIF